MHSYWDLAKIILCIIIQLLSSILCNAVKQKFADDGKILTFNILLRHNVPMNLKMENFNLF